MWWIVEWTVVGFGRLLVVHFYNRNTYGGWKCCGRSDMLYNNYRNSFRKAVFQNCKIVSDAIWGRGNIINRQVRKMYLIKTIKGDITKVTDVQAIVNAANNTLLGGGGVDGAIHRAAGPQLLAECRTLNGCETGQAKITKGYNLPAKYVIHTVGPVWYGGEQGEPQLLADAYRNSLKLAEEHNLKSIAFPAISTGVYGYPKEEAAHIAIDTIREFLKEYDMEVVLTAFSDGDLKRYERILQQDL